MSQASHAAPEAIASWLADKPAGATQAQVRDALGLSDALGSDATRRAIHYGLIGYTEPGGLGRGVRRLYFARQHCPAGGTIKPESRTPKRNTRGCGEMARIVEFVRANPGATRAQIDQFRDAHPSNGLVGALVVAKRLFAAGPMSRRHYYLTRAEADANHGRLLEAARIESLRLERERTQAYQQRVTAAAPKREPKSAAEKPAKAKPAREPKPVRNPKPITVVHRAPQTMRPEGPVIIPPHVKVTVCPTRWT